MNDSLINHFIGLGVTRKIAAASAQVYLELCEVKKLWDVNYTYNANIKQLVLNGKKHKNGNNVTFIPWLSYNDLNFNKIEDILAGIEKNSAVFVIIHPDSTTVYYQVCSGLATPSEISAKNIRDNKSERLDFELKRHEKLIEYSALCGIPLTISNNSKMDSKELDSETNLSMTDKSM